MVTVERSEEHIRLATKAMRQLPDEDLVTLGKMAAHRTTRSRPSDTETWPFGQLLRGMPETATNIFESLARVEQRSVVEVMSKMQATPLRDGRVQLSLPGEQALSPFPPRVLWKLKDVAIMRKLMVEFYESPFGLLSAYESMCRGDFQATGLNPSETAPLYAAELHKTWASQELLLMAADEPFVDMMEAAALSAPTGPLESDELLSDSGVIFFQRERLIPMMSTITPVRGVLWYTNGKFINMQVLIDGHYERDLPGDEGIEPPVENYSYLYVLNLLRTTTARPEEAGEGAVEALGFLRSIAAIARSSQTRSETKVVERREKKGGRVRNIHRETVRILSLRNPEYGRYELDGATGRKLRQHWVRGHWRNQWYAGEQINKTIWIDGFVRGDAALGIVTGQKVYVARGTNQSSTQQRKAS
jgi:hypothetical protein